MKTKPAQKVRIMIYLPAELERTLRYAAFLERGSISSAAEHALAVYFKEHAIEVPADAQPRKAVRS
jgi:hypothetical protein